ncbi:hypothetical protein [Microbacterium lacticum]|uniref:hypothetical protein n=1 Tax=Microbacterium lacticum TaxID=33885 RepID=UPI002432E2A1|nr:hypothetical protein [Microbacterium lacticum]
MLELPSSSKLLFRNGHELVGLRVEVRWICEKTPPMRRQVNVSPTIDRHDDGLAQHGDAPNGIGRVVLRRFIRRDPEDNVGRAELRERRLLIFCTIGRAHTWHVDNDDIAQFMHLTLNDVSTRTLGTPPSPPPVAVAERLQ